MESHMVDTTLFRDRRLTGRPLSTFPQSFERRARAQMLEPRDAGLTYPSR
jgi:hypothetical protein